MSGMVDAIIVVYIRGGGGGGDSVKISVREFVAGMDRKFANFSEF